MLVQIDKYRSVEIPPSDKFKAYVVSYWITGDEVKIVSKHKSDALAVRAGKIKAYQAINEGIRIILEDGLAYHPDAFTGY